MKESNYWNNFLDTGSVEDYLNFKQVKDAEEQIGEGVNPNAGQCERDRNDIEDGAYRGL